MWILGLKGLRCGYCSLSFQSLVLRYFDDCAGRQYQENNNLSNNKPLIIFSNCFVSLRIL